MGASEVLLAELVATSRAVAAIGSRLEKIGIEQEFLPALLLGEVRQGSLERGDAGGGGPRRGANPSVVSLGVPAGSA